MNTNDKQIPVDEARWQAQEKARRGDADADADDLRIARALRHASAVDLPPGFAAQVAALARRQVAVDSRMEQRLLRGLVFVFALSAAVVVAWFGRGWFAALAAVLPGGSEAVGWSGIAALCLLGNWAFGALRRQFERGPHAAA